MPGPVPKRSDQRRRANKPAIDIRKGVAQPFVEIPPAEDWWHSDAADFWASLPLSGQSEFYEPSDWQLARWVCRIMTELAASSDGMNASLFKQMLDAMDTLMVSEGSRRRKGVELHRDPDAVGQAPPPAGSKKRDRSLLEAV